jgi:hypothetical protein
MYGKHAACLVERGWSAAIPLIPGEKRPSISGWEKYNTKIVTLDQAKLWARQFPDHGIGHAAGHGLVGIDLDTDQKKQAVTAKKIADRCLGSTPMVRVGRPPRVMRYYRLDDWSDNHVATKSFHLFAIYATTGQTAWFGTHPKTDRPYYWPDASPLDVSPSDLPAVSKIHLKSFVDEMTGAFPAPVTSGEDRNADRTSFGLAGGGPTTLILREMGLSPRTPPVDIALTWISSAAVGTRHHTMVGAVIALATAGLDDEEIFDPIFHAHLESLAGDRSEIRTRRDVESAIQWARDRIGSSLDTLDSDLHVSDWSIWP